MASEPWFVAALIAIGSCTRGGLLIEVGLPITMVGCGLAVRSAWALDRVRNLRHGALAPIALAAMAATGLLAPATTGGALFDVMKRLYFLLALAVVWRLGGLSVSGRRLALRVLFWAFVIVQVGGLLAVPEPKIDNWAWTQACLRALTRGVHPYTLAFADVPGAEFGRDPISAFPYPPLTLVLLAPGYLLWGDYRIALTAAAVFTAMAIRWLGRRLHCDEDQTAMATFVFLLHPRGFNITVFGHAEPVMALAVVLFAYFAAAPRCSWLEGCSFWILPSLKQYMVGPALLYAVLPHRRRAMVFGTGLLLAVVAAPFFVGNAEATWHGIVLEANEWTGPDPVATSLAALSVRAGWWYPGRFVSPAVQLIASGVMGWRLRERGVGGLMLSSSIALLATFLTGWQAYPHYFYLVSVMLLTAGMTLRADQPHGLITKARPAIVQ